MTTNIKTPRSENEIELFENCRGLLKDVIEKIIPLLNENLPDISATIIYELDDVLNSYHAYMTGLRDSECTHIGSSDVIISYLKRQFQLMLSECIFLNQIISVKE